MSFQNACGRLGRQTSARTKTSAHLKITFVDMTYPKALTGSLPLCPLIFSCSPIMPYVCFLFVVVGEGGGGNGAVVSGSLHKNNG